MKISFKCDGSWVGCGIMRNSFFLLGQVRTLRRESEARLRSEGAAGGLTDAHMEAKAGRSKALPGGGRPSPRGQSRSLFLQ